MGISMTRSKTSSMNGHKGHLTRRAWLIRVIKGLAGLGAFMIFPRLNPVQATETIPAPERRESIGETFANESMVFTAGFFIFPHAGDAEISLVPLYEKGRYQATISGKTRGIIGFLTRHREDTHISELVENEKKDRFICIRLIRDTKIGNDHTIKIFEMDYQNRKMTVRRIKGKRESVHVKPIPPGVIYDDPLTAFYNFRFGTYGPVRYGKSYKIDTIPGKKVKHIFLHVASKKETEEKKKNLSIAKKVNYLVYLRIAPEIIKSKKGEIEGWFTPSLIPLYGVAKDVIFFGDVKGKLVHLERGIKPQVPL